MQYLKIKSMTDEAIKTASAEGRLFRRFRLRKKKPLITKPFALHEPGCICGDPDGYFKHCARSIAVAKTLISHGQLFVGVE